MVCSTTTPASQTPIPIFPTNPIRPTERIGSLADQFRCIDCYLKISDHVREIDRDFCWSYVCDLFMERRGANE